jgi:hypothetical protein
MGRYQEPWDLVQLYTYLVASLGWEIRPIRSARVLDREDVLFDMYEDDILDI